MKNIYLFLFLFIPFTSLSLNAEEEKQHPIDVWLSKQIDTDSSTAGMLDAIYKAQQMWDKEMNKVYARLMKELPKNKQTALKNSQRSWIAFRDANFKETNELIADQDGSMWRLQAADARYQTVKNRVLQLLGFESALP